MKNQMASAKRRIGIVLLVLIAALILAFLFMTPVSPLKGDVRAGVSDNPLPAQGFWGKIGFYERAADNNFTYMLMLTFFVLAIGKTIQTYFLRKRMKVRTDNPLVRKSPF